MDGLERQRFNRG